MSDPGKYVARLEQRLTAQCKIAKAKAIVMTSQHIWEEDAYDLIRDRGMTKPVATEETANAVINANKILGMDL
jgi:AmiR/NasT family two-component response regulator